MNRLLGSLVVLAGLSVGCDDTTAEESKADAGATGDATRADADNIWDQSMPDAEPVGGPPDIIVEPLRVQMVSDIGVESAPEVLLIRNVGGSDLSVTGLDLTQPASGQFRLVDAPSLPAVIPAGSQLEVQLTFQPAEAGERQGNLQILSDDPDGGDLSVTLLGKLFESCLRAMPATVDVGPVDLGSRSGTSTVQVINCGDRPLTLQGIRLEDNDGFDFEPQREREVAGAVLGRGENFALDVWYQNDGLLPGVGTTALLYVDSDIVDTPPLRVTLRARGGSGESCLIGVSPERVEFDLLRIGLTRAIEVEVTNAGTGECELRSATLTDPNTAIGNDFTITRDLGTDRLAAQDSVTIEITYSPTVDSPVGDRANLVVAYHDPHVNQNRTARAFVQGTGTTARFGPIPEELYLNEVTAPNCASKRLVTRAQNVGFVPICVSEYRFEGLDCGLFVLLEEPEIDGCIPLADGEAVEFPIQYQPLVTGEDRCTLVVTSDAMEARTIELNLVGRGVARSQTTDTHTVDDLNARQRAWFGLRRPAVADSVEVYVNDERNRDAEFDEDSNRIFFERGDHPDRDDEVRIEYRAICFDRVE